MKKKISLFLSSLILVTTISAQDIQIQDGWQLLGATQELNVTKFDEAGCVDYIWKYNNQATSDTEKWQLHVPNTSIYYNTGNYGNTPITSLNTADGYWVKATGNCDIPLDTSVTSINLESLIFGQTLYVMTQSPEFDSENNIISNTVGNAEYTFNTDLTLESDGTLAGIIGAWKITDNKLYYTFAASALDTMTNYHEYVSGSISDGCVKLNHIFPEPNSNIYPGVYFTDKTNAETYAAYLNDLNITATDCPRVVNENTISYETYLSLYKPMMPNLSTENKYFHGNTQSDSGLIYDEFQSMVAEPIVSDKIYTIGAGIQSVEVRELTLTDINISDKWSYYVDGEEQSTYTDVSTITYTDNMITETTTSYGLRDLKFSKLISIDALEKMFLDIDINVTFNSDDKAQFRFKHQNGITFNAIDLVLNESAYMKVKAVYETPISYTLVNEDISQKVFTISANDNQGWVEFITFDFDSIGYEVGYLQDGTQEYSEEMHWTIVNGKLQITLDSDSSVSTITFDEKPAEGTTGIYIGEETLIFNISSFTSNNVGIGVKNAPLLMLTDTPVTATDILGNIVASTNPLNNILAGNSIHFNTLISSEHIITIPGSAIVDVDISGDYNSAIDKPISDFGFTELTGLGDGNINVGTTVALARLESNPNDASAKTLLNYFKKYDVSQVMKESELGAHGVLGIEARIKEEARKFLDTVIETTKYTKNQSTLKDVSIGSNLEYLLAQALNNNFSSEVEAVISLAETDASIVSASILSKEEQAKIITATKLETQDLNYIRKLESNGLLSARDFTIETLKIMEATASN